MIATVTAVNLTEEQQQSIAFIRENLRYGTLALAGPAGSGKTTLIRELQTSLEDIAPVTVTATTNKAAAVLRKKDIQALTFHQACMRPIFKPPMDKLASFLDEASLSEYPKAYPMQLTARYSQDELFDAFNIMRRSGIYAAFRHLGIKDVFKYIEGWSPAPKKDGILVIDESSMLGSEELKIAEKVYDHIILVGDEYQLPPVKSEPVFWNISNRVSLKQIHRQAENSQPLHLANAARNGEKFNIDVKAISLDLCKQNFPVIVWRNKTREKLTNAIRQSLGYDPAKLYPGEILICRNSSDRAAKNRGLYNNSMWTVLEVGNNWRCTLESDTGEIFEDESVFIEELDQGFGVPFRFGYALTCHNAQGSEWDKVQIHFGDACAFVSFNREEAKRWLYTAITRAKQEVLFVSSEVN